MRTVGPAVVADPESPLLTETDPRAPDSAAYRASLEADLRTARSGATPAAAFHAARRQYLAGRRIDMLALANELEISRATLYRWTGPREQLISDVAFSLSDAVFEQAKRDTAHLSGPPRLLAVFRQHVEALVEARPLQVFLQQETHAALRILTGRGGSVQRRTVARLADLYRSEQRSGSFHPRADPDTLAYAVVRITEGFIYNDAILAVEPAVDEAAAIVALLLI
jgi:Tetracyclin repressor-like, C-terminal domain